METQITPEMIAAAITALVPILQVAFRKWITDQKRLNVILPHVTGVLLAIAAHLSGHDPAGVSGFWGSAGAGLILGALGRFGRDFLKHGIGPVVNGIFRVSVRG